MAPAKEAKSAVDVHTDDEAGTVAIGATIEGVFVPFYTLDKPTVDSLVATGKAKQEAAAAAE